MLYTVFTARFEDSSLRMETRRHGRAVKNLKSAISILKKRGGKGYVQEVSSKKVKFVQGFRGINLDVLGIPHN